MREVEIYDGLRCIGCFIELDAKRCEAYDSSGGAIGVFPSHLKAAKAVYEIEVERQRMAAA